MPRKKPRLRLRRRNLIAHVRPKRIKKRRLKLRLRLLKRQRMLLRPKKQQSKLLKLQLRLLQKPPKRRPLPKLRLRKQPRLPQKPLLMLHLKRHLLNNPKLLRRQAKVNQPKPPRKW